MSTTLTIADRDRMLIEEAERVAARSKEPREALLSELRDIRALTIKPGAFDSTLIIRKMCDAE